MNKDDGLEPRSQHLDELLDGEAGPEGPRLLAELEKDPEEFEKFQFSKALDLALKEALPTKSVPDSLWQGIEARIAKEPTPRADLPTRMQLTIRNFFRFPLRGLGLTSAAFMFFFLWSDQWLPTPAYFPTHRQGLHASSEDPLEDALIEHLEQEGFDLLEEMMLDYHSESLELVPPGIPPAASEGSP